MITHQESRPRKFKNRPQYRPEGTGLGKPQSNWDLLFKVLADAVLTRVKGTMEAWIVDRRQPLTVEQFRSQMAALVPFMWEYVAQTMKGRNTDQALLLMGRVYKMYYSGTSDRGTKHDPSTRAVAESGEHWHKKVPPASPLWRLHEDVLRSRIQKIPDWPKYLKQFQGFEIEGENRPGQFIKGIYKGLPDGSWPNTDHLKLNVRDKS